MANKNHLVITIGRQYGSGGRMVGQYLAKELGIHFYDDEILTLTSEESAIGEPYFRLADEKAGNNLLYKIVAGLKPDLKKPSLQRDMTNPDNLFKFQSEVIRRLAREESCVIVGRCADYILEKEDVPGLVRVFVYADWDVMVNRVMEHDHIDEKEASQRVKRMNKKRKEYYRYYTGQDWEDWSHYDVAVNTGHFDLNQTGQLIKYYIDLKGFPFRKQ